MDEYDQEKLLNKLREFSKKVEAMTFTLLVFSAAKARDREEFRALVFMIEYSSFRIATAIPEPILKQALDRARILAEKFSDDSHFPCEVATLEEAYRVRQGIKSHFFAHHSGTERIWMRREWETIHEVASEIDDVTPDLDFPELDESEPMDICDQCSGEFNFEDLVEVEPIDQETGKPKSDLEFWCDSCLKSGNQKTEKKSDEKNSSE